METEVEKSVEVVPETVCPECGSDKLVSDHERGETICGECGLVVNEQTLAKGRDWRAYSPEEAKARTRASPITYAVHDMGLRTTLKVEPDARGHSLNGAKMYEVNRLSKLQGRSACNASTDRSLLSACQYLESLAGSIGLKRDMRERAAVIFRKALAKKLVRGRSITSMVAGAVYFVCREQNIPRNMDEIARVAGIRRKDVGKVYRVLLNRLELKAPPPSACTTALTFLSVFVEKTRASREAHGVAARHLHDLYAKRKAAGKDPRSLAASALYIAAMQCEGRFVTQKDVAEAAGVTEVTVGNRYKSICQSLGIKLKEENENVHL